MGVPTCSLALGARRRRADHGGVYHETEKFLRKLPLSLYVSLIQEDLKDTALIVEEVVGLPKVWKQKYVMEEVECLKMRKVAVGIVGTGFSAERHAIGYRDIPDVEIRAVAGAKGNETRTEEFARKVEAKKAYTDYAELLREPDIEIISICIPTYLHEMVAVEACEHGKHLIVEKPLARTAEEGDLMVRAARKANVKLMYAENLQYAPCFVKAQEIIKQGSLGQIFTASAREAHSGPYSSWFRDPHLSGGGALIDLGIHDVQLLRVLTSSEPKEVSAALFKLRRSSDVEDNAVATIKFENGTLGMLEESWTTKGGYDVRVEVYGTESEILINPTRASLLQVSPTAGSRRIEEKIETLKAATLPIPEESYIFGYIREIGHFVQCVIEDQKPITSGEDGLTALRTIEAMYESANTGRTTPVRTP